MKLVHRTFGMRFLGAWVGLALCFVTHQAGATPPDDDLLTPLDAGEVRNDLRLSSFEEPAEGTGLWFALSGSLESTQTGSRGAGMLLFGGALDRFAKSRALPRAQAPELDAAVEPVLAESEIAKTTESRAPATRLAAGPPGSAPAMNARRGRGGAAEMKDEQAASPDGAPSPAPPPPTTKQTLGPPPLAQRATGALARGLVRAALKRAREREARDRIDGLATRARASALLPEVRFRIARVTNQDQALSPTEYDPSRVTASGGSGFWLEGRATFRLDRLVFADEEVQIERLRAERARFEAELVKELLGELTLWQRGAAKAADVTSPDDERMLGEAAMLSAAAALDVLSDGWFGAHAPE